jgi:predicted alpha/beta-hydrolase family hydrolase
LARKPAKPDRAVLLTPGAGAGADQPSLVAIDDALAPHGVPVDRLDFPYRKAGRKSPDKPAVLIGAVAEGAGALSARTGLAPDRLLLGGRSMGGRMCSMAVADGAVLAALGLVLISYPLHPPGHPEKSRTEHLPRITVPCLFVSGTRDAFGTPDELEAATATIAGPVTHVWIDGGDHGLRRRDTDVAEAVVSWVLTR